MSEHKTVKLGHCILSVDFEAAGGCPKLNFATSVGLALIDVSRYTVRDPRASVVGLFTSHIRRPEGKIWDERCVRDFWSNPKMVDPKVYASTLQFVEDPNTPSVEKVGLDMVRWLGEMGCRATPPAVVVRPMSIASDNPAFDFMWWQELLPPGVTLPYLSGSYAWDPIDINSFYAGYLHLPVDSSASVSGIMAAELAHIPRGQAHDALDDAMHMGMGLAHVSSQLFARKKPAQSAAE